ncbi:hypothetical protein IC762_27290 [Bradyrhizobium genosp. L]|uniref:hypothetical protein n=1 Tax=Bradyrhizobium genosp. L TaxID=83637 RepID=UPI0018A289B4|nr:hypothetical protein [Bradyrhizobium genosp. L]QPF83386.1 hypothetical protein IC762_27290 [Bradyrhizobium genosp. L]
MPIHLENETLSIALPAGWVDQSDNDVLDFVNPSTNEELTIGFGQIKQCADARQLSGILWSLIESKAKAFGEISAGQFTVLDAVRPTRSIPSNGEFSGLDSKNSIYARVSVTGNLSQFISVSYYLHRCNATSAETGARARAAIGMCRIKGLAA